TIATQVSPPSGTIALGASFADTAILGPKPPGGATPTGTVLFQVYANGTCSGTPALTSTNALNASGTSAASDTFSPVVAGTYHVVATYSGDANYPAAGPTASLDAAEQPFVTKAALPVTTQVSPPSGTIVLGESFTDTATLGSKPAGAPNPTGTVLF